MSESVLALIPARAGSKGLPGKNTRLLAGTPLIGYSVLYARECPTIQRSIVSTDSHAIASIARDYGVDDVLLRPSALAEDTTPMWSVVRHALDVEEESNRVYDYVLLLQPTSPFRKIGDVERIVEIAEHDTHADGVISVAELDRNPLWDCVMERDGYVVPIYDSNVPCTRRQDMPTVYLTTGAYFLWRSSFVRSGIDDWTSGNMAPYIVSPECVCDIDTADDFEAAERLVATSHRINWIHRK